jgi:hypothetical protein
VLVGHTFDILEALVKSAQVDLIVMGSHNMTEGTEPAVGTLSHRLFFLAKVPILYIR